MIEYSIWLSWTNGITNNDEIKDDYNKTNYRDPDLETMIDWFEDYLLVGFIDHSCLSDAAPHKTQELLRPAEVSRILAHLLTNR